MPSSTPPSSGDPSRKRPARKGRPDNPAGPPPSSSEPPQTQSAAPVRPSGHSIGAAPPSHDPIAEFVALVANMGKGSPTGAGVRTGGFVTVVRREQSLEPLQAACGNTPPDYLCFTLRYRVDSRQAFGTLVQAAMRDLAVLLDDEHGADGEVLGHVEPAADDIVWEPLRAGPVHEFLFARPRPAQGVLDAAALRDLFIALTDPEFIPPGTRLVILGEVVGADEDPGAVAAWNQAAELLFRQLPERVGLVLSGAPHAFDLPDDPVHFLEIEELPGAPDAADREAAVQGEAAARFQPAELLADVPTTQDHLDREAYAASLAAFLLHPDTAPPITIGLYGKWGAGKSSFFGLVDKNLASQASGRMTAPWWRLLRRRVHTLPEDPVGRVRWTSGRQVMTVMFNAWQYDDAKQTWAGLASTISERLEKALPLWRRQWMRLKYAWHSNRSDVLLNFGLPVLLLALAAAVLLPWLTPSQVRELAPQGEANENPLGGLLKAVLPAGSLLLLLWGVGWRLVEVLKPVSERVAGYVKRTDYRADMGYQHKVIDDLKFLLQELEAARPGCRVLVYIDDLDRCSDEKIVEILRATILILADCRLFVMFGMDTEMIRRAIAAHYEKMKVPLADPQSFAESYLRKIVQIALYLPEAPPERRFSLVESMFSPAARQAYREREAARPAEAQTRSAAAGSAVLPYDLASIRRLVKVETVEDTADELAALAALKDYLPDNARELKRFVNTHRFLKILLSASGASWSGRKQQGLVKWLLFCTGWPARVDDVLRHARANPGAADCLAAACAANDWDEEACAFAALGVPLPAAELLGDFDLAARLSQVVHDDPPPPSAGTEKVQLDIAVVAAE